jgi:hypothetical protein
LAAAARNGRIASNAGGSPGSVVMSWIGGSARDLQPAHRQADHDQRDHEAGERPEHPPPPPAEACQE